jgi:hypothetical protein
MSRREDIETAIWDEDDFVGLSPHAQLTYIWSFTNSKNNMAGMYRVRLSAIPALGLALSPEQVQAALEELGRTGFVFYDGSVLWVKSRVRHLRTKTKQVAISIARAIDLIGVDHKFVGDFLDRYGDLPWLREQLADLVARSAELNVNRGSGEPQPTFTGGSGERLANVEDDLALEAGSLNVTRTSPEPRERFTGKCKGDGVVFNGKDEGVGEGSAGASVADHKLAEQIAAVTAVLRRRSTWEIDPIALEVTVQRCAARGRDPVELAENALQLSEGHGNWKSASRTLQMALDQAKPPAAASMGKPSDLAGRIERGGA